MSLINIRNLDVTFSAPLFAGLNLIVNKGDRLGLVAANGTGKSTLISCIDNSFEATTGEITTARGLRIGHVQQHLPANDLTKTLYDLVLAALPPEQVDFESWRVDVVLDDLNIPFEFHHVLLSELSGGWQRQAMLAAAWVNEPDVLMLDEPTNHLDLPRVGQLQKWLAALPRDKAVILISHDRAFLEKQRHVLCFCVQTHRATLRCRIQQLASRWMWPTLRTNVASRMRCAKPNSCGNKLQS